MKQSIYSTLFLGIIMTAALMSGTASAEEIMFDNPANRSYWGVRVGLDVTVPGAETLDLPSMPKISVDPYKPGAGVSVGAIYNVKLVANLYLEPGVMLYYNTVGGSTETGYPGESLDVSLRELGLRVPVNVGYHVDFDAFSIKLFTGPELRYGLHGTSRYSSDKGGSMQEHSESLYNDLERSSVSWQIGCGLAVGSIDITLSGAININNLSNNDYISWRCNRFTVGVGYNF